MFLTRLVGLVPKKKMTRRDDDDLTQRLWEAELQRRHAVERQERYQRRRRKRVVALVFVTLAVLLGLSHVLEHMGAFRILDPGWQDLLLGYPMASVLLIVGGILWGT
ncbi:MAG: hypothetical protein H0T54_02140 [Geodermatophilaceae bacterium]|nr:hypothetical protein [Geodermatophilaceae bacterium]